mgnify:CR=1 FL=1
MKKISENIYYPYKRTIEFLFEHVPVSINGESKVQSVTFKTPTGEKIINCGLVISAIGYKSAQIDGVKIESGALRNSDGFVGDNLFVVGWAKRGPSGVIGTNKSDAAEVIKILLTYLPAQPKKKFDLNTVLNKSIISQPLWEKINTAEISAGEALGKPRLKAVSREELLGLGGV